MWRYNTVGPWCQDRGDDLENTPPSKRNNHIPTPPYSRGKPENSVGESADVWILAQYLCTFQARQDTWWGWIWPFALIGHFQLKVSWWQEESKRCSLEPQASCSVPEGDFGWLLHYCGFFTSLCRFWCSSSTAIPPHRSPNSFTPCSWMWARMAWVTEAFDLLPFRRWLRMEACS